MAFPASSATKAKAWDQLCALANNAKSSTQRLRDQSAAGATRLVSYVRLHDLLEGSLSEWAVLAQTPGLQAYAQDQITDPSLNLVAEYQAMRAAAIAVRDWIVANGDSVGLSVSTAESAGFRLLADDLIASIG